MTKFAIILIGLLILLAWTAIRYRKQIAGVIGFARMLREVSNPNATKRSIGQPQTAVSGELVNCPACHTWIPRDRAIRFDAKTFYCSKECVKSSMAAN